MLAGHETTANALSFSLLELARHPEIQMRLREEIRGLRYAKAAMGDPQINVDDLDSLPYMIAVVKVTRFIVDQYIRGGTDRL
jgi:cytochrome P450